MDLENTRFKFQLILLISVQTDKTNQKIDVCFWIASKTFRTFTKSSILNTFEDFMQKWIVNCKLNLNYTKQLTRTDVNLEILIQRSISGQRF